MDSGSTGNFIQVRAPVTNIVRVRKGKRLVVAQPDGSLITSTHTCDLPLPSVLPDVCRQGHIFPSLHSGSLLSIGLLCDHGCIALLAASAIYIYYNDTLVMVGERNPLTKLWIVKLGDSPSRVNPNHHALSLHPFSKLLFALGARPPQFSALPQRIAFYHAALFSPVLSIFCNALNTGYLTTWPELTSALVRKYPPQSRAMIEGHLDQQRVNTATSRSQGHRTITLPINNLPFPHGNR